MDKLDTIFAMQKALNDDIVERRNLNFTQKEWLQKTILATISELAEVLDETQFKWWKNEKPIDEPKLKEELVDVLHFFVSMCLRAGMDADELFRIYCDKNKENFDRQYGRSEKKGYEVEPHA